MLLTDKDTKYIHRLPTYSPTPTHIHTDASQPAWSGLGLTITSASSFLGRNGVGELQGALQIAQSLISVWKADVLPKQAFPLFQGDLSG